MERTFSKMGGGSKDNTQWYYIDKDNNYVGPVNTHKMRQLKKFDYVTPESYVWASHLSGWKTFAQVPDLAEAKGGGGGKGSKAGAPPSIGMAKKPQGSGAEKRGSAAAAPNIAGLSLEDQEGPATVFSAGRPDMTNAPVANDEWDDAEGMRVLDEDYKIRAVILADGEVRDGSGATLAFIEANGEVGSVNMDYLGKAANDQVTDRDDQPCGAYDQGRGNISDLGGSVLCEISKEGVVQGNGQRTCGRVQGWTFANMQTFAAFIALVDPSFVAGY